jgi:hypothetical protein
MISTVNPGLPKDTQKVTAGESQKKAIDDLKSIEAGQAQQHEREQEDVKQDVTQTIGDMAASGGIASGQGISNMFKDATPAVAQVAVQQQSEKDELTFLGSMQEEDYRELKQSIALQEYVRKQDEAKREQALLTADSLFQMGMTSKQMVFHQNSEIADRAFQVLAEDFERGRVTAGELAKMQRGFELEAVKFRNQVAKTQARIEQMFSESSALTQTEHAKDLLVQYNLEMERIMKAEAKAANIAGIIKGVFTIGGAVIGGIFGNVVGAGAGAAIGSGVGEVAGGIFK